MAKRKRKTVTEPADGAKTNEAPEEQARNDTVPVPRARPRVAAVLSTTEAALGWRAIRLGSVRVGYLIPGGRGGATRWQLNMISERLNGNPTGSGDEAKCRHDVLVTVRAWLAGMNVPTEWIQSLRWED